MPARLVSLQGRENIPIERVVVVVGRHRECDHRLDSSRVSRRHCCLALDGNEVLVRDLGSTNGTWINGLRVQDGVLSPGDELGIAHLRFRLELQALEGGPPPDRHLARQSPAALLSCASAHTPEPHPEMPKTSLEEALPSGLMASRREGGHTI